MSGQATENQSALRTLWNHPHPVTEETALTANRTPASCGTTHQGSGRHGHQPIVLRFDCQHLTRSDTLEFVSEREAIEEISDLFLFLADHDFAGYSPIYERLARSISTNHQVLEFVLQSASPNTRRGRVPVLFFAATHDRILANPSFEISKIYRGEFDADPLPPFLELLEREREAIVQNMCTRSVQTNEVGRSAAIALGLAAVEHNDQNIVLVELGPSAGLNLFVDHWHIDYVRDDCIVRTIGPANSPVQLTCELRGDLTPPATPMGTIDQRTGVDPAPIDASNAEQSRWLQACVWPGIPDRPERLAAALSVVSQHPPSLLKGDAVDDLAPLVAALPRSVLPVVLSTWALAYVSAEGRDRILSELDALGRTRDLAIITLEEPRLTPWIETPNELVAEYYEIGDGTPTVLGIRQWINGECFTNVLALCHPHVRWMRWLDEGTLDG